MSESKPSGNGVARFNLWIGIGASILTFLASVFVGGYWMANLQSAVDAQAKATTAQAQQISQSNRHFERNDAAIGSLNAGVVKIEGQLTEVETQMNCQNIEREGIRAYQDQMNGLLAMGAIKIPQGSSWPVLNHNPSCTPPNFRE